LAINLAIINDKNPTGFQIMMLGCETHRQIFASRCNLDISVKHDRNSRMLGDLEERMLAAVREIGESR